MAIELPKDEGLRVPASRQRMRGKDTQQRFGTLVLRRCDHYSPS
jgi:hypothetical protein